MKKLANFKSFIILVILLITSCEEEVTVTTVINQDGSCERIMVVKTDSIDFFSKKHLIPIDTTWSLTIEPDTSKNEKFIYTARKKFTSIAALNELYVNDTSYLAELDRTVELKKRFRWFYTFFEYKEVYNKMFDQPSLSSYLNEEEMHFHKLPIEKKEAYLEEMNDSIKSKKFEDDVDEKFETWISQTFFNAYYEIFEKEAAILNDSMLTSSSLKNLRDSFKLKDLDNEEKISNAFFKRSEEILRTKSVWNIKENNIDSYNNIDERWTILEEIFLNSYDNHIEVPGLIIDTNAEKISGDTISWEVTWDKYFTEDFEMIAESRIVNKWAFYVSGAILIFVITLLITGNLKKKKGTK